MAISSTGFFSSYQLTMGLTYARGYEEVNNLSSTLQSYVSARQLFLGNMSSSEVVNGLNVVNAHLSSENNYNSAATNIEKTVLVTLNNFFNTNYGVFTRDVFNSLSTSSTIAWNNSFKEAWYQSNAQELVQQIGFATYNGSAFSFYPASSAITNIQNTASVASSSGVNVNLTGYVAPVSNFAMPGYYIIPSSNGLLPSAATISFATTVTGLIGSSTLSLSGGIGAATSLFAFRPLKNPEYLEFRFGTSGVTGIAATSVLSDIVFNVTLTGGTATTTIPVTIAAANTYGRVNIGTYGNAVYKATGVSAISLVSGSNASLGTQQSVEIWVKSTF